MIDYVNMRLFCWKSAKLTLFSHLNYLNMKFSSYWNFEMLDFSSPPEIHKSNWSLFRIIVAKIKQFLSLIYLFIYLFIFLLLLAKLMDFPPLIFYKERFCCHFVKYVLILQLTVKKIFLKLNLGLKCAEFPEQTQSNFWIELHKIFRKLSPPLPKNILNMQYFLC